MTSRTGCQYYNECAELIYPDNPEARNLKTYGRSYKLSLCDTCFAYAPEDVILETHIRHDYYYQYGNLSPNQWDRIQQIELKVDNLLKKVKGKQRSYKAYTIE